MKKILLLAVAAILAAGTMQAKTADELRIYLNPGHGSWGPNDRPMATIPYPNLPETGMPDTCGFYESNTNLWKVLQLGETLEKMGIQSDNIVYSRVKNGPYPYVAGAADAELYNRPLSEICEEVELGNFDMFISVHSNAHVDGNNTNYPLYLYRGYDNGVTGSLTGTFGEDEDQHEVTVTYTGNAVEGSWDMCDVNWGYHYMSEIDPQSYYSPTQKNLRGDISFQGSGSVSERSNGNYYGGYYGVLKHGVPGFLVEGYFHTYQPARHRALNMDYCHQEGVRIARGVCDYFNLTPESTGYIMGTVKDLHEKIVNSLFQYSAGTNDQWLPLNGATVKLLKNGNEVASYTVDNNYNGVFFFGDLEPGEYTLDATLDGYKPLFDEYKEPVTVTANATTYPLLFLENVDYVPPTEVFENYPEPELPSYMVLANEFNFDGDTKATFDIAGTVTDVAQSGDSTVILSNDGLTPHLYLVNAKSQELIKELSVEGIFSEDSEGFYSPLYSIAFTADHKLVGSSLTRNQYSGEYVDAGFTRGTARLYIWNDMDAEPALWATTQNSGNFYRADVGHSIAVNGPSNDCQVLLVTVNRGATPYKIRLVYLNILDGEVVSTMYDNLDKGNFNAVDYGDVREGGHLHLAISPNGDDKAVLGGSKGLVTEFVLPVSSAGQPSDLKQLSNKFNLVGYGFSFFRYAKHSLMVAPYAEDGVVKGVRLLDVTNGLDQAALIKTNNTDLAPSRDETASYDAATASVKSEELNLFLAGKTSNLHRFTTEGVDQPVVKGIYAYGLNSEKNDDDSYTFTFTANSDANEAYIVFIDAEGNEVGRVEVPNVVEGVNTVTLTQDDLPGYGGEMNWAVNLVGNNIPTIALINTPDVTYSGQVFNTVDRSPESPFFGRIYVGNRVGSGNAGNGMWIYSPEYERVNDQVIKARTEKTFGSNYRMGIDSEGKVYVPDWADGSSGVFVFDPSAEEEIFYPFFANEDGSFLNRSSDGLLTNAAGEAVAGSSPGVFVAGKGAETKLFVYNEDLFISGVGNNVSVYNIGNEDGTIATYWNQAPSANYAVGPWQLNTNGNVWGYPDGSCWVSQYRSAGNNASGVPSLMFVDPEGNVTFNSGKNGFSDYLNGSDRAGFAVNGDNSVLVINDGSGYFQFFDLEMDGFTPILTPKYSFKSSTDLGTAVYQMNFDYAGNLVATGNKMGVFSIPTEDNQTTVPAKMSLLVNKIVVNSITLNHTDDENIVLKGGESLQLEVVAFEPQEADPSVTWSSSDETVAIVDETGLVTAVALTEGGAKAPVAGETFPVTITATSVQNPNVTASVTITVDYTLTGVEGVAANKQVVGVKYINAAGMQSNNPFEGVNIVVTTYDDGSQKVTKVIR